MTGRRKNGSTATNDRKKQHRLKSNLYSQPNSFPPEALGLRERGHATGVDGRAYSKKAKR